MEFKEKYEDEKFNVYPPTCSIFEISSARGHYQTNIKKEKKVFVLEFKPENPFDRNLFKYHDDKVDIES